jgi:hypothetical protein
MYCTFMALVDARIRAILEISTSQIYRIVGIQTPALTHPHRLTLKLRDPPANLLINLGIVATLQERRLWYHFPAGFEPGTSGSSTMRINHYATRSIYSETFLRSILVVRVTSDTIQENQ